MVPAARLASLLALVCDAMTTACEPTGSVPDQRNVTPVPHEPPGTRVIALSTPPIRAVTLSARQPLLFLYRTVTTIAVAVVPERGETPTLDRVEVPGGRGDRGREQDEQQHGHGRRPEP